ncbi:deoxyribonuclease TATDN1-like [Oscarella lobularis]|uniref:deoxyribonuclease TATDN1-like n=1 Tax=Oscarella lobularis TaxID=121494 RepID=UPI0033134E0D
MLSKLSMAVRRFIDIGANLTDPVFRGTYRGKKAHPDDLDQVLKRARDHGVDKIVVTGGSLEDSQSALDLAKSAVVVEKDGISMPQLYSTAGCHPTRCQDFVRHPAGPDRYLDALLELIKSNGEKIIAVGECGLDYDRLHFCPKDVQLTFFEKQFQLAEATRLPMFLHSRSAHDDFYDILKRHRDSIRGGVVHSFTGTPDEARALVDLDLYIGINGCSLKTNANLLTAASIPSEKLMIETDAPWCEIRPSHAGYRHVATRFGAATRKKERWEAGCLVKSRNEPVAIVQVLEILAAVRNEEASRLAERIYRNTIDLFFADL